MNELLIDHTEQAIFPGRFSSSSGKRGSVRGVTHVTIVMYHHQFMLRACHTYPYISPCGALGHLHLCPTPAARAPSCDPVSRCCSGSQSSSCLVVDVPLSSPTRVLVLTPLFTVVFFNGNKLRLMCRCLSNIILLYPMLQYCSNCSNVCSRSVPLPKAHTYVLDC